MSWPVCVVPFLVLPLGGVVAPLCYRLLVPPAAGCSSTLPKAAEFCWAAFELPPGKRGSAASSRESHLWVTFSVFSRLFPGHHVPLIRRKNLHFTPHLSPACAQLSSLINSCFNTQLLFVCWQLHPELWILTGNLFLMSVSCILSVNA